MFEKIKISKGGDTAQCDERQLADFISWGWVKASNVRPAAPIATKVKERSLVDIVDDRALIGLKSIGIDTVEDFLAADEDDLRAVRYVTDSNLAKSLAKAKASL